MHLSHICHMLNYRLLYYTFFWLTCLCILLTWQAEKLHTKTLPYPFTSKEVFEQSIRVPVGPEFNPATAVGALTRPDVSAV